MLQFTDDLLTVMERTGQLPLASLEEQTQLIEEKKNASEHLNTLTQEMNKLKSTDTAITVYETKFQEMKVNDQK